MKKLLILLICLGICSTLHAQIPSTGEPIEIPTGQITKEGALGIVEELFPDPVRTILSYTSPDLLPGYWYFMVDPQPWVKQDHSCWLVRVPAETLKAMTENPQVTEVPSVYSLPAYDYIPEKAYNPPVVPAVGTPTVCTNDFHLGAYPIADSAAAHTYAIILSGGIMPYNNTTHYWNDCAFMYRTLRGKYQIPKDNITLLMGDGDDPGLDQYKMPEQKLVSSNTDLDGDGKKDLKLAATKENLINSIKNLYGKLGSEDHLFLFVTDHGISENGVGKICLWNRELIDANELTELLRPLANSGVTLSSVMGQCYSGKFKDTLKSIGCVTIGAAQNGSSWHPDIVYDAFLYSFTCAIAGCDHTGKPLTDFPKDVFKRSFHDAFQYAFKKVTDDMQMSEVPWMDVLTESLPGDLSFDYVPKRYHLYLKDNLTDNGLEPNRISTRYWESPYLWVRNNNDKKSSHENPVLSMAHPECYVNVTLFSNGREANPSESQWLQLYWADASTVITERTWRGLEKDSNGKPTGGPIGAAVAIPSIQPGETLTMTVPWNISSLGSAAQSAQNKTFCILASIIDSPWGNNYKEGKTKLDAWKFKRQAQKNVTIIERNGLTIPVPVYVRNPKEEAVFYNLSLETENPEDQALFDYAFVDMKVNREAYENWQAYGSWLEYCSEVEEEWPMAEDTKTIRFDTADAKIGSMLLEEEELIPVTITFTFHSEPSDLDGYTISLVQRDENGNVIGGETFDIQPPIFSYEPIPIEPPIIGFDDICLTADTTGYDQMVWYDASGTKKGAGATLSTRIPSIPTTYKVIGRNLNGEIGIGSVTVDVKRGMESVGYNPSTHTLSGSFFNPSGFLGTITITPVETLGAPQIFKVEENQTKFTIEKLNLTAGSYLISYSENDVVFNTKKISVSL